MVLTPPILVRFLFSLLSQSGTSLVGSNGVQWDQISIYKLVKSVSNVGKFTVTLKSDFIQIKIEEVNKIGNYYFRNLRFYNIYFFSITYTISFLQPYGGTKLF